MTWLLFQNKPVKCMTHTHTYTHKSYKGVGDLNTAGTPPTELSLHVHILYILQFDLDFIDWTEGD